MYRRRSQVRNLQCRKLVIPATHPSAAGVEDEKPSSHGSFLLQEVGHQRQGVGFRPDDRQVNGVW